MFDWTIGSLLVAGVAVVAMVRGAAYISPRWDKSLQERSDKRQSKLIES